MIQDLQNSKEFQDVSRPNFDLFSNFSRGASSRFQFLQGSIASGPPRRSRSLRRSCLGSSSPGDKTNMEQTGIQHITTNINKISTMYQQCIINDHQPASTNDHLGRENDWNALQDLRSLQTSTNIIRHHKGVTRVSPEKQNLCLDPLGSTSVFVCVRVFDGFGWIWMDLGYSRPPQAIRES